MKDFDPAKSFGPDVAAHYDDDKRGDEESAGRAAAVEGQEKEAGRRECEWQRAQLPNEIRALALDDQKLRNEICWFVFGQ
ncbi:MAG: hypothetical protein CNIPEHKO_03014 [Anaerolineales bacterium]|nr:hypothetical protein [Anaerolineales bacterium]